MMASYYAREYHVFNTRQERDAWVKGCQAREEVPANAKRPPALEHFDLDLLVLPGEGPRH